MQTKFCLSEINQPLVKFATCKNLLYVEDDVKSRLVRVQYKRTLVFKSVKKFWEKTEQKNFTPEYHFMRTLWFAAFVTSLVYDVTK